jgi:hypothetical protein
LLGAWLAGAMVELLPNVQPGTLDRVDADPGVAHVLHDAATARPAGIEQRRDALGVGHEVGLGLVEAIDPRPAAIGM